jgi:hypothetical protein
MRKRLSVPIFQHPLAACGGFVIRRFAPVEKPARRLQEIAEKRPTAVAGVDFEP